MAPSFVVGLRLLPAHLRAKASLWKHIVKLRKTRFWPKHSVTKSIDGVRFECDFELDLTGLRMYVGLYEPWTVAAMRRFLAKGDTFIDVGANIGYLSAVGASLAGPNGCVHSFEPVPEYFQRLKSLAETNPRYAIIPNRVAVGDREGTSTIRTSKTSIGANTIVPGLNVDEDIERRLDVSVVRLDAYIESARLERISLIKIDTEGFEFPVLRGLGRYLEGTTNRPAIIVEVEPMAYPLLGHALADLRAFIDRYGYRAYRLDAIGKREIDVRALQSTINLAFVASFG